MKCPAWLSACLRGAILINIISGSERGRVINPISGSERGRGILIVWLVACLCGSSVGRCLKERLASERVGNGSLVGRWGKSSAEDSRSEREACYSLSAEYSFVASVGLKERLAITCRQIGRVQLCRVGGRARNFNCRLC